MTQIDSQPHSDFLISLNNTAKAMTRMMGVPDFEYIVAEHPLSSLTDEQCRERAETLLPEVERILVGSAAAKTD